ncbi:MAG: hypothetical protein ACM3MB_04945 [Acidobacteriota bacterium]
MFSKPIRVVLTNKEKCLLAFDVDLAKLDDKYWGQFPPGEANKHICELKGGKAYAYGHLVAKLVKMDAASELERHWSVWLNNCVDTVFKSINDPEFQGAIEKERETIKHTQFAPLFDSDNLPAAIYHEFVRLFWEEEENPVAFVSLIDEEFADALFRGW